MDIQFTFPLLVFFVGLIFIIIIRSFNSLDHSNKSLPPQPWKLPLVGHIHHLIGAPPHHALRNIARKLGPVVSLQLGQVSAAIISSPPLAKEIMKTHDISFATRPKSPIIEILTYNYKDIAFAPYGDYWRQMRKICVLELLSSRRVQSFRSIREQESWDLIESIYTQRLKTINLSDKTFTMINTIISKITIGSRCKDQAMLLDMIQEGNELSGGFDVSDLFPSIGLLALVTGTRKKMMKIRNKGDLILDNIILEHKDHRGRVNGPNNHADEEDLVDVLLRLKDDGGLEFPLSFDNIKAVILQIFAAGSDTSAVTIQWAMSELMKNPRVMKKAQHELRQVLKGKTKIHESDIQELHYLKLVIKETLRLHPPIPFLLPRECSKNCEIGGFHIPVNTKVLINAWLIGRDPDYWNDPESFTPERFSESSFNMLGTDFEYFPFGAGRRMCPGMLLGLTNVELPLAMLLYHFDWELPNGTTSNDFDMLESFGTTLKRKNDLLLVPHPYNTIC
ncbi:cytochrome P450 71AV8-like [Bidens hawaiensis]|uniref:cytochrome P450 71AV8-like n=1 Tax=Bidens hawaiensis TaxID=980011 RepID=UPI0040496869